MTTPRDQDRSPAWSQPEPRLTGIVLPSFDDPAADLDEIERDRRTRTDPAPQTQTEPRTEPRIPSWERTPTLDLPTADDDLDASSEPLGPPVRVVPSGPPPAWPPPEVLELEEPSPSPLLDDARPEPVAAQPRRDFPRYIHGELVLTADPTASTVAPTPLAAPLDFDPLTAPADVLNARLNAPQGLQTALPSWAAPRTDPAPQLDTALPTEAVERTPVVDRTPPPPPLTPPPPATWAPQPAPEAVTAQLPVITVKPMPAAAPPMPPLPPAPVAPGPAVEPVGPGASPAVPSPPEPATTEQPAARRGGPWSGTPHPAFPDATARTFRILPIAADLLPLEISETRHARRVRSLVISGVVLVAGLVLAWYGLAVHENSEARAELQREQDITADLVRQKHRRYDELTRIQADTDKISAKLRSVLAHDLSWSALLVSLQQQAAPQNVKVTGVTGSLNADLTGGGQASTGDALGTITITGNAGSKKVVAAYVDSLGKVPGLANPFPTDATQEDGVVAFTIKMDITKAALGGRYTTPTAVPTATGGK